MPLRLAEEIPKKNNGHDMGKTYISTKVQDTLTTKLKSRYASIGNSTKQC